MAATPTVDDSRPFRTAVTHYLRGRPPYAPTLIRRVSALVGLTRADAVLDLGCGPAQLARAFARFAGEVTAMDPEPEMLDAAEEASRGIGNIRFVPGGSDHVSSLVGPFRLVTMGRSFHWMDRPATLHRLNGLIEPGGAIALFATHHPDVPENAWVERFAALRRHYRCDEPGRRRGLRHEAFLLASPFSCVESCSVLERRTFEATRLVDRAFSSSGTAPQRLGDRAASLQRDIVALAQEIAPNGWLEEVIESGALIGRRPEEEDSR